ncbi:MAG: GspH/FimT family pseudopilin [Cellvibrionaceae bacterium]
MTHRDSQVTRSRHHFDSGFTLVELLITVAIISITLAMAVPNFTSLVNSNAIASQTNHFSSAIGAARSEAITRNTSVIMCKRNNLSCSNGAQWESGWIIFADNDGDDTLDSGEELRYIDALRDNYTLRPSVATLNWLRFQSDGKVSSNLTTFSGVTFRLCGPDADNAESRAISFNVVGQARLAKGTTSCP